jgi:hypothetical protein
MKRGTNNGFRETVLTARVSGAEEYEAYDQLGPCTRQMLRDSPLPWLAFAIVKQLRDEEDRIRQSLPEWQRDSFHIDLKDPQLDRNIARGIMTQSMQVMQRDRSEEDARLGMQPLRLRRTLRADYRR